MKVRIKKAAPSFGSQNGYSLYNKSTRPDTQDTGNVGQSISAVPRDQATIEAEKGESIIGDYNNDGYMDHFSIGGEKHSQGGTPLAAPKGSFIFSDKDKGPNNLLITDKAVLEHFGKGSSKKGLTPAELAKQYDINSHVEILKDPNADPIAKRTAQLMLDNNTKKLAELADYQESMKGYPNGTPAIAQSASPDDMEQAALGGLIKFGEGGNPNDPPTGKINQTGTPQSPTQVGSSQGKSPFPSVGTVIYANGKPVTISRINKLGLINGNKSIIETSDHNSFTVDEWNSLLNNKSVSRKEERAYIPARSGYGLVGDQAVPGKEAVNYTTYNPSEQPIRISDMTLKPKDKLTYADQKYLVLSTNYDNTGQILVSDSTGKKSQLDPKNIKTMRDGDPNGTFHTSWINDTEKYGTSAPVQQKQVSGQQNTQSRPATVKAQNTTVTPSTTQPVDNEDYNKYIVVGQKELGGDIQEFAGGGPFTQTGNPDSQEYLRKQKEAGYTDMNTTSDFKTFGDQHQNGNGYYTSDKNTLNFGDFARRHGDWINKEYKSASGVGINAFIKDIKNPSTSGNATNWFQDKIDARAFAVTGKKYFTGDVHSAYAHDGKFGQYTYAAPSFNKSGDVPVVPIKDTVTPTVDKTVVEPKSVAPVQNDNIRGGGWWAQDVAKTAAGLTDKVHKYEPSLYQLPITQEDYSLLDPSRRIAAEQEQYNKETDAVMNGYDGQAARGTLSAVAGQTASQVSNDIASVENANVGIVNQVNGTNAQLSEQGTSRNVELRKRYDDEMAVLNQQTDNAQETLKNRNLKNWMDGVNNKMKTDWLESVTPQINVDRMTGEIGFTGKGKIMGNSYESSGSQGGDPYAYIKNMNPILTKMWREQGATTDDISKGLINFGLGVLKNQGVTKDMQDPETMRAMFARGLINNGD